MEGDANLTYTCKKMERIIPTQSCEFWLSLASISLFTSHLSVGDSNFTPLHKYYISRVSLRKDYEP